MEDMRRGKDAMLFTRPLLTSCTHITSAQEHMILRLKKMEWECERTMMERVRERGEEGRMGGEGKGERWEKRARERRGEEWNEKMTMVCLSIGCLQDEYREVACHRGR